MAQVLVLLGLLFYRLDHSERTVGLVVDEAGNPRPSFNVLVGSGASMVLRRPDGRPLAEVTTDEDGRFATDLPHLDPVMIVKVPVVPTLRYVDENLIEFDGELLRLPQPSLVGPRHFEPPAKKYSWCGGIDICEEMPAFTGR
jgi:hypothetical protein